jgi:hypothetical protein
MNVIFVVVVVVIDTIDKYELFSGVENVYDER